MKADFIKPSSETYKDSPAGIDTLHSRSKSGGIIPSANTYIKGFNLDFTGRRVERNGFSTYGKDGKDSVYDDGTAGRSVEQFLQDNGGIAAVTGDISIQHDYNALMSNSMTSSDYARLREEGFDPMAMSGDEIVTVIDQIKAKLLESGVEIEGYNSDLSAKELTEITGSAVMARVVSRTLAANDLPITEDNVTQLCRVLEMADNLDVTMSIPSAEPVVDDADVLSQAEDILSGFQPEEMSAAVIEKSTDRLVVPSGIPAENNTESLILPSGIPAENNTESLILPSGIPAENNTESLIMSSGIPAEKNIDSHIVSSGMPAEKDALNNASAMGVHDGMGFDDISDSDMPRGEKSEILNAIVSGEFSFDYPSDISKGLSDAAIRYLLLNDLEPTLENVYMAEFKGTEYPYGKMDESVVQEMMPQISGVIKDAGFSVSKDMVADAVWLMEADVMLSSENFRRLESLKGITFPLDRKKLLDGASGQLSKGKSGVSVKLVKHQRIIHEAKLDLTRLANRRFFGTGFEQDTKDLEKKIDELKKKEEELVKYERSFIKDSSRHNKDYYEDNYEKLSEVLEADPVDFYNETNTKIREIRSLPVSVVAKLPNDKEFSLKDVYTKGSEEKDKYVRLGEKFEPFYLSAAERYRRTVEAVGTQIRPDLGDSLEKVFERTGDILKSIGLDANEDNKRAVRILGYNHMEITRNSVEGVKAVDSKVRNLIDSLNPSVVLKLIRNGINPLNTSVDELRNIVSELKGADDTDKKYSEFLWQLEKNNQISEAEKESYIGIYRLFSQVEKTDGEVVGVLLNQNMDLSVKNLLSATRSIKSKGMDYTIDSSFAGVAEKKDKHLKIDAQINQGYLNEDYYRNRAREIIDNATANRFKNIKDSGVELADVTLEEFADRITRPLSDREALQEEKLYQEYNEELAKNYREAMQAEDSVINALMRNDVAVTAENVNAMQAFLYHKGELFKKLKSYGKEADTKKIIDAFEDRDKVIEAVEEFAEGAQDTLQEKLDTGDLTYRDYEGMLGMKRQLTLMAKMASNENYEVPVMIDGELSAVSLKIIHNGEKPSVNVTAHSDKYGDLGMNVFIKDNEIQGYFTAKDNGGAAYLTGVSDRLQERLKSKGYSIKNGLRVLVNESFDIASFAVSDVENDRHVSSVELYRIAKSFLQAL